MGKTIKQPTAKMTGTKVGGISTPFSQKIMTGKK